MKNKKSLILPVIVLLLLAVFNIFSGNRPDPADTGIIGRADESTQIVLASDKNKEKDNKKQSDKKKDSKDQKKEEKEPELDEDGVYDSKEDVALYIQTFGHLPSNYITKKEARAEGWEGGSLEKFCPGKCIGGDYYGNYESLLPKARGREYHECDIDTLGERSRGAKRLVFSNDGLIYYTDDHYESFTFLSGDTKK